MGDTPPAGCWCWPLTRPLGQRAPRLPARGGMHAFVRLPAGARRIREFDASASYRGTVNRLDPAAWEKPTGVGFEVRCRTADGSWNRRLELAMAPATDRTRDAGPGSDHQEPPAAARGRLVRSQLRFGDQLYDLRGDPGETVSVASAEDAGVLEERREAVAAGSLGDLAPVPQGQRQRSQSVREPAEHAAQIQRRRLRCRRRWFPKP